MTRNSKPPVYWQFQNETKESENDKIIRRLRYLENLFPDTDSEFLHLKVVEMGHNDFEMNQWIERVLENNSEKDFPSKGVAKEQIILPSDGAGSSQQAKMLSLVQSPKLGVDGAGTSNQAKLLSLVQSPKVTNTDTANNSVSSSKENTSSERSNPKKVATLEIPTGEKTQPDHTSPRHSIS